MTDSLYLLTEDFSVRNEETVNLGVGADAAGPVIHVIETIDSIVSHSLILLIPRLIYLAHIRPVGERKVRRDVQIFECSKRSTDRYAVLPAVLPVFYEVGLHQLVLLRVDGVSDVSGIAHVYFLIPALFTYLL